MFFPEGSDPSLLQATSGPSGNNMAEQRQTERQKTTDGALIFFGQEPGVFSCTLRDINDFGIGLRLNDPAVIEGIFNITLDNFKNVQSCRMIWSRGRYIGATFLRAARKIAILPEFVRV